MHLHTGKVIEHWRGLRTLERSQTERWHGSDSENEVDDDWSDGDDEDMIEMKPSQMTYIWSLARNAPGVLPGIFPITLPSFQW